LIRFRSYDDGKIVNRYGVAIYTPGDDLLRLRTTSDAAPLTEWLKLRPDEQSTQPTVRFRRV
jgi:hypothetical protein